MKQIRTRTNGRNKVSLDFRADRKENVAPAILEEYFDDGIATFRLANGNTQPVDSYNSMWNRPKAKVLPKGTKDDISLWGTNQIKAKHMKR